MSFHIDHEESINTLSERIGKWADGKGFWDDWNLARTLERLAEQVLDGRIDELPVRDDNAEALRLAAKALRNNVAAAKLMLIVSEMAEALETLRDNGAEGVLAGKGNFIEELADGEIRIKDLAYMVQGNLGGEEMKKIKKNVNRPHKHGRQM